MKKFLTLLFLCLALAFQANATTHCWTSINRNSTRCPLTSEAYNWKRNIQGNSGSLSWNSLWAGDQYVKESYRDGDRALIQYRNFYLGNQLAAALCPLIYDIGSSVATNVNFVAGDFTEVGGLGSNPNTNKYLSLGFTDSQIGSSNSYSVTFVLVGAGVDAATYSEFGAGSSDDSQLWRASHASGNGAGVFASYLGGNTTRTLTQTAKSICTISRVSTTSLKAYINGSGGATVTTSTTSTPNNLTMVTFARAKVSAVVAAFSPNFHFLDGFGYGMSDAQAARESARVTRLLQRTGRL